MYSYVASTFYLKMKGKFYLVPSYLLPNKVEFITKSYTLLYWAVSTSLPHDYMDLTL